MLGGVPEFFAVESFHVGVERKLVAPGVTYSASQAVVKIRIGEERLISAAEGNGPVNALDLALRKDLGVYQKHIEDLELRDYRVRVFQGGTDAVTRVLIEFGDGNGDTLVDGRRVGQHHRRFVPGAGRCDHLSAAQGRRRGAVSAAKPQSTRDQAPISERPTTTLSSRFTSSRIRCLKLAGSISPRAMTPCSSITGVIVIASSAIMST